MGIDVIMKVVRAFSSDKGFVIVRHVDLQFGKKAAHLSPALKAG